MSQPRRRTGLRRFIIGSLVSLLLVFAATVVLCVVYFDDLVRYRYMSMICSDDDDTRARGVSYLIRNIEDPQVLAAAEAMLDDADEECFNVLVRGLALAGAWGPSFEKAWVRYLVEQALVPETAAEAGMPPDQLAARRTHLAVELGKLLWNRRPHSDHPQIADAVDRLLHDPSPIVRLNALSAAASLPPGAKRIELIRHAAEDTEPQIARHAWIMLHLLGADDGVETPVGIPEAYFGERPNAPPEGASAVVLDLAALEAMPTASSDDIVITDALPDLIRIQAVRVSRDAEPADLDPVFNAEAPETRDLAVAVALERFTDEQNRELAKELTLRFTDEARMAGAMLGGMVPAEAVDEKLTELLRMRALRSDAWAVGQHFKMAMTLRGEAPEGFNPHAALLHPMLPKTTMIMALLHAGDLAGTDWLLNPFAEPPADLQLVFDADRWWHVFRRYFPDAPEFWLNADLKTQRFQIDVLRDWYLLHRPTLRFDRAKRVFTTEGTEDTEEERK